MGGAAHVHLSLYPRHLPRHWWMIPEPCFSFFPSWQLNLWTWQFQRMCHNIPWQLIPSWGRSHKSHFLLELFQTRQIVKRSSIKCESFASRRAGFCFRDSFNCQTSPKISLTFRGWWTDEHFNTGRNVHKQLWKWKRQNKSLIKSVMHALLCTCVVYP